MYRLFLTATFLATAACGSQPAHPTSNRQAVRWSQNPLAWPSPVEVGWNEVITQTISAADLPCWPEGPASEFGGPCQAFTVLQVPYRFRIALSWTNPDAKFAMYVINGNRMTSTYSDVSPLMLPSQMVSSGEHVVVIVQLQQGSVEKASYTLGTSAGE